MNEISILMNLLSNRKNEHEIGATKKEILQKLNISNRDKNIFFYNLITNLSKYIEPLGLQIKFNPINSHWFISYDSEVSDLISANPFGDKSRLAATLFCALVASLKNPGGISKIAEIQKLRNKKGIIEDLKELEQLGYVEIALNSNEVKLTPLIGYHLDLEELLIKVALKTKE
jgi:hypothetical protein